MASARGPTVCLACQFRFLWLHSPRSSQPSWQASRHIAHAPLRRRVPLRMTLSQTVARPPPKSPTRGRPNRQQTANNPFGGMNMRQARIPQVPEATAGPSNAHRGRSSQRVPGGKPETFHALKMQRALVAVPYGKRTSIKTTIGEWESFDQFNLLPVVKEALFTQALAGLEDVKPTPIQRLSIPALLGQETKRRGRSLDNKAGMQQFLLAAETGSGKTLAYLLPIINALKRAEAEEKMNSEEEQSIEKSGEPKRNNKFELESPPLSTDPHQTTGRPRVIILLPTSELVTQVGQLVKALSHKIKFRSALISSAYSGRVIRSRLFSPNGIDVLVSTPHLLSSIAESDPNVLSKVTHLVIDEADSLMDRSFASTTSAIIDRSSPSLQQVVLCSATIPRSLDTYLRKRFPDMRRLVTPNLHAVPRRVQLGVVDVEREPYYGNKSLACADNIWTIGKAAAEHVIAHGGPEKDMSEQQKRIIVFVNERETTKEVADFLVSKGIDAVALHRDTPEQRQTETLAEFTSLPAPSSAPALPSPAAPPAVAGEAARALLTSQSIKNFVPFRHVTLPKRNLPNTKVLVTTDLGSRGIDTVAVRHVILYDVPHSTIDFIHRLGRTGRMGRRGRGIVLVRKKDRKDVVREVREGMFKGQALI